MIYLTEEELESHYGKQVGGSGRKGRFNAKTKSSHSDDAYKYEFGYLNGHCVYAITEAKKRNITLAEAEGLRYLSGKNQWFLNTAYTPEKHAEKIQELLDKIAKDLEYFYTPSESDRFKHKLICVHQRSRKQLVIYHPKWRPDLSEIEADPL